MEDLFSRLRASLSDRFRVEEEVGHGGMSIVFRARDLKHDRDVAIKVLRPELSAHIGRDRFLREIGIAASLQHPHILPLFDSGEVDGFMYYMMPYAPGQSLRDLLRAEGQLSIERAVEIVCEVADALEYAHESGVVHRDIKPSNIMISSGHAVVTDFGVARAVHAAGGPDLTASGMALGTPSYMSPEQAAGDQEVDGRSDIYSLACVLYETLAGDPPFMASTPQALIARQILDVPPSLEVVRPNVPPHVAATLQKALAKVPADRFDTAADFKGALEGRLKTGPLPTYGRPAPRRRRMLGLAGAAAAVVAAAAAAWWTLLRPAPADLSPNRVAVFPLTEGGFSEPGAGLDVAVAIENALVYAGSLEMASGTDWLGSESEEGRGVGALAARRIAADLGARYLVGGAVQRRDDSVTVRLDLYDLVERTEVRERATGLASDVGRVGIAAVVRLLPSILDPERAEVVDLAPLLDRSPESIALWIQGDKEYRRSHFASALAYYEQALASDSLLAYAAAKGALAASWEHEAETALRLGSLGIAHESLLPRRYAYFARGVDAYQRGLPTSAIEWLEKARAEDPYWSEPWAIQGEVYFHLLPAAAPLDSLAEAFFAEAVRRDSTYSEPLFHLTELAARRGDLEQARSRSERLAIWGPEPLYSRQLDLMLSCLEEDPGSVEWIGEDGDLAPAFNAGAMFASGGFNPDCARSALDAVLSRAEEDPGYLAQGVYVRQGVAVMTGRPDEALALLDSVHAAGLRAAEVSYFVDALAGVEVGRRAAEADAGLREALGDRYERLSRVDLLGLLAVWNLHEGSLDRAEALAARLAELGAEDPVAALLARALEGHTLLAEADTAGAVAAFESLVAPLDKIQVPYSYGAITPLARLELAEVYLARREWDRAYLSASVFDHPEPIHFLPFVRRSLEVRLEAARGLGRTDLEQRIGDRLEVLRSAGP